MEPFNARSASEPNSGSCKQVNELPVQSQPPQMLGYVRHCRDPLSNESMRQVAYRFWAGVLAMIGAMLIWYAWLVKYHGYQWSRDRSWTDPDRPAACFLGMGLVMLVFGFRWALGWRWPWGKNER